jgi:hypothetical protein
MKTLYLFALVLVAGCSGSKEIPAHQQCVETCDRSLDHCVQVLGEVKTLCHVTYGECMGGCRKN